MGVEKSDISKKLLCVACEEEYSTAVTHRRDEGRLSIIKKVAIKYRGVKAPVPVIVENISFRGARVRYARDDSLSSSRETNGNSIIKLDKEELQLHTFARVV